MQVYRFSGNPIIQPHMDSRMGDNINGPSLIRAPAWLSNPLGRYYLYFAHHDGAYIRLAYSDDLNGPWRIYEPGVMALDEALFAGHIASPDVHIDAGRQQFRMYFHGSDTPTGGGGKQTTRLAFSGDGLHFRAQPEDLGAPYWRVFRWRGYHYALAMPGIFYRSSDGMNDFVQGPTLFTPAMRHAAVMLDRHTLTVFYSNVGDKPERILAATIDLRPDWMQWRASEPLVILEPELNYEGGLLPRAPSVRGLAREPLCQLRDPALFQENGRTYLLYAVAGERGIAIAELK